jgi:thioredoxin reductase (NADPH)
MRELEAAGSITTIEKAKAKALSGSGDTITGITVQATDGDPVEVAADHVLVFFGLAPKLGPIAEWGLDINRKTINVDTEKFETSEPGIYAVGDINFYPGKKKLILCGFHEAALAAFAIKARVEPDKKGQKGTRAIHDHKPDHA